VLGNPQMRAGAPGHVRAAAVAKSAQARGRAAGVLPYLDAARRSRSAHPARASRGADQSRRADAVGKGI